MQYTYERYKLCSSQCAFNKSKCARFYALEREKKRFKYYAAINEFLFNFLLLLFYNCISFAIIENKILFNSSFTSCIEDFLFCFNFVYSRSKLTLNSKNAQMILKGLQAFVGGTKICMD